MEQTGAQHGLNPNFRGHYGAYRARVYLETVFLGDELGTGKGSDGQESNDTLPPGICGRKKINYISLTEESDLHVEDHDGPELLN